MRQEEMKPRMFEKLGRLKERTRCELGSPGGPLVRNSRERIK